MIDNVFDLLPIIHFDINGNNYNSAGNEPCVWEVNVKVISNSEAMIRIMLDGTIVGSFGIQSKCEGNLLSAIERSSSLALWSAMANYVFGRVNAYCKSVNLDSVIQPTS